MLVGMKIAAAIWASLNAILASDAVFLIYQNDSLFSFKGGTYRTNLHAGRFGTMVAHLGYEKGLFNLFVWNGLGKPIDPAIRGDHFDGAILFDGVLFDPASEEKRLLGNVVLYFAGLGTSAAADAFFNIYGDAIPWTFGVAFDSSIQNCVKGRQGGGSHECSGCDPGILEEIAAGQACLSLCHG